MIYNTNNESDTQDTVKIEKEICTSFVATPQTTKAMTTVCDKCLIRTEKSLNCAVNILRARGRPHVCYSILLLFYFIILLLVIVDLLL